MIPPDPIDSRLNVTGRGATLMLHRDDMCNEPTGTLFADEIVAGDPGRQV